MLSLQPRPYGTLRDAFDRLFETSFSAPIDAQWSRDSVSWPINVFEDGEAYRVQALIPGSTAEHIQVTAQPGGYLTISGDVKVAVPEDAKAIWSEFGHMKFRRDVALPLAFNTDDARVTYENGVLTIVLPKSPEARPRMIKVLSSAA